MTEQWCWGPAGKVIADMRTFQGAVACTWYFLNMNCDNRQVIGEADWASLFDASPTRVCMTMTILHGYSQLARPHVRRDRWTIYRLPWSQTRKPGRSLPRRYMNRDESRSREPDVIWKVYTHIMIPFRFSEAGLIYSFTWRGMIPLKNRSGSNLVRIRCQRKRRHLESFQIGKFDRVLLSPNGTWHSWRRIIEVRVGWTCITPIITERRRWGNSI